MLHVIKTANLYVDGSPHGEIGRFALLVLRIEQVFYRVNVDLNAAHCHFELEIASSSDLSAALQGVKDHVNGPWHDALIQC